jgi:hypothetical protein
MNGLIFLLTTATGVTVILFNNSFLKAWVGDGFFAGDIINVKHDGYIINATLDLKKKVYLSFFSSLIFIAFSFVLIEKLGIAGLCISLISGKFLLFIGQRKLLKNKIQHDPEMSSFQRARPFITSFIMLSGAWYLTTFIQSVSLFKMLALGPVAFIVSFLIYYLVGLRKKQRAELLKIISAIKFFKSN